jgi:hypothetical protein
MEGRFPVGRGNEEFAEFLCKFVRSAIITSGSYSSFDPLKAYMQLTYGNPKLITSIPYSFADRYGIFKQEVKRIKLYREELVTREYKEKLENYEFRNISSHKKYLEEKGAERDKYKYEVQREISKRDDYGAFGESSKQWSVYEFLKYFVVLNEYPAIQRLLEPYYTDCLRGSVIGGTQSWVEWLLNQVEIAKEYARKEADWVIKEEKWLRRRWKGYESIYLEEHEATFTSVYFKDWVLDTFSRFLRRHNQGALTALVLLFTFDRYCPIRGKYAPPEKYIEHGITWLPRRKEYWAGLNACHLPRLTKKEPFEVFQTLWQLSELVPKLKLSTDCAKYYWRGQQTYSDPYKIPHNTRGGSGLKKEHQKLARFELFDGETQCSLSIKQLKGRKDIALLKGLLDGKRDLLGRWSEGQTIESDGSIWFHTKVVAHWLDKSDEVTQTWLMARACDIYQFGHSTADWTFPQPTIPGQSVEEVSRVVDKMVAELRMKEEEEESKAQKEWMDLMNERKHRDVIKPDPDKVTSVTIQDQRQTLPGEIPINDVKDLEEVVKACRMALQESRGGELLAQVEEFVQFITLLSEKDNHIEVPTDQYIEVQIEQVSTREMLDRMAQELRKSWISRRRM